MLADATFVARFQAFDRGRGLAIDRILAAHAFPASSALSPESCQREL